MLLSTVPGFDWRMSNMPQLDQSRRITPEGELYYLQVPVAPRPVDHAVDFLTVTELLDDEPTSRAIWEMLSTQFKTRSKFLSIWPSVRYVAVHYRDGELAG